MSALEEFTLTHTLGSRPRPVIRSLARLNRQRLTQCAATCCFLPKSPVFALLPYVFYFNVFFISFPPSPSFLHLPISCTFLYPIFLFPSLSLPSCVPFSFLPSGPYILSVPLLPRMPRVLYSLLPFFHSLPPSPFIRIVPSSLLLLSSFPPSSLFLSPFLPLAALRA